MPANTVPANKPYKPTAASLIVDENSLKPVSAPAAAPLFLVSIIVLGPPIETTSTAVAPHTGFVVK